MPHVLAFDPETADTTTAHAPLVAHALGRLASKLTTQSTKSGVPQVAVAGILRIASVIEL